MTETISPVGGTVPAHDAFLKHTVSFTRKLSDGNYGTNEAFFALQFDTALGASFEDIQAHAMTAFAAVKAVVLEQLGLGYDIDDQGVIREDHNKVVAAAAPAPDAVTQVREVFGGGEAVENGNVVNISDAIPSDLKSWSKKDQTDWLTSRLASHPNEFFDNRLKKQSGEYSDRAPDFKHKKTGLGLWSDSGRRSA